MRRICGIAFGVAVHGLFFFTAYRLVRFLHADTVTSPPGALSIDALLASQFAVLHSLLLWRGVRQRLSRWIPAPFYGLFFCAVTCLALLAMFAGWRSSPAMVWRLSGRPGLLIEAAFCSAWGLLLYALHLSGLGYQTGFTPWWHWVRGQPLPERGFRPRGLYRLVRHPVYLSFLALIWLNPVMSNDRLLLACLWSGYLIIGSHLKDRRLAFFLGETYRVYQEQVPGFPLIPPGPLGRRQRRPEVVPAEPAVRPGPAPLRRAA